MFFFNQIYLKLTNLCKMGCKHCYIPSKIRNDENYLNNEKLEIIFNKLVNHTNQHTSFSIHGGEPLLLDVEYYKNFFKIFKKYFKDNYIDIQTSLYPFFKYIENEVDNIDKYLNLFVENKVVFSVSFDFEGIRLYKGNYKNYMKFFLKTVDYLNHKNIKPVLIITITKYMKNNENKIYEWLVEHHEKFSRIITEDYTDIGSKELKIKNSEIANIYINLYKLDKKNNFLIFPYFNVLRNNIKNNKKLLGRFNVLCQKYNLVIEPNGDLTNCPDKSGKEYYSNIFDEDWYDKYKKNSNYLKSVLINNKKLEVCKNCEYDNVCNGGCPLKKKQIVEEKIFDKNECSGFYPFLKFIDNDTKG